MADSDCVKEASDSRHSCYQKKIQVVFRLTAVGSWSVEVHGPRVPCSNSIGVLETFPLEDATVVTGMVASAFSYLMSFYLIALLSFLKGGKNVPSRKSSS